MRQNRTSSLLPALACATALTLIACGEKTERHECFLAHDTASGEIAHETKESCGKALPPASTFKIPNAMIVLESGAITRDETIEWDGFEHPFEKWREDHDLESALRYSVVWFFQQAAARVDPEEMKQYLDGFAYGSGDTIRNPFMFWLTGEFRITPVEQLAFLLRFFRGETPGISGRNQRFVKDAIQQKPGNLTTAAGEYDFEIAPGADLHAKTGFVDLPDKQRTSWLVGQIERDGRVIVFVSTVYGTDPKISGLSAARLARKRLAGLMTDAKE